MGSALKIYSHVSQFGRKIRDGITTHYGGSRWPAAILVLAAVGAFFVDAGSSTAAQDATTPVAVAGIAQEAATGSAAPAAPAQATARPLTPVADAALADGRRFTFNFAQQPWRQVLDWYAKEADLSLTMEAAPTGTFNYNDTRRYNATEALDILNRVLFTTKGFLLVRHDKILVLVNLEANEVAPSLIPDVPLEELDSRGEYELIRVIFPVWNMTSEQALTQVQNLLGPKMKVVSLPQSRQLQVTELAGRLRVIRKVIEAGNQPGPGGFRPFELKHISADVAMPTIRQALGIPTGADQTTDTPPSARLTRSAIGNTLLFQGTAEGSARVEQILALIDVSANGIDLARQTQLYSLGPIDADTARKIFEETFRGNPSVSVMVDAASGNLTAIAPPGAHATIRATLEMLQKDARQVAVIPLVRMDPLSAKTIVSSMFGGTGTAEQPNPNSVSVDFDTAQRVLIVRGTKAQITQVRDMLAEMGEAGNGSAGVAGGQRIRRLQYPQGAAMSALSQIQRLMPELGNRITVLSPSSGISVRRPTSMLDSFQTPPPAGANNLPQQPARGNTERTPTLFERNDAAPTESVPRPAAVPGDRGTRTSIPNAFRFVAQESVVESPKQAETTSTTITNATSVSSSEQPQVAAAIDEPQAAAEVDVKSKPIIIVPSPTGLVVVSDDVEALNELEDLLSLVAPPSSTTERQFAVFYLRYATADSAAAVLSSLYGTNQGANQRGGRGGGRGGRGGNIVEEATAQIAGQLAGSAGTAITGLISGATGLGAPTVDVVPIVDHNAILVRAKASDIDMIEQILDVLDQRAGPVEDLSDPEPRRIQINHMNASDMATIIQSVYADRIANSGGGGGALSGNQLAQLFGGGGAQQEPQKMTLTADSRTNQLIVRAPDLLFEKVKRMCDELDQVAVAAEVTRVIPLSGTALLTVRGAIEPLSSNAQQQQTANTNARGGQGQRGAAGGQGVGNQLQQLQQFQQLLGGGRAGGRGAQAGGGGQGAAALGGGRGAGGRGAGGRGARGGRGGG